MTSDNDTTLDRLRHIYSQKLPFNQWLGLAVGELTADSATLLFSLRDELIGNYQRRRLHGGVISAVLDTVGGLTASAAALTRRGARADQAEACLAGIGTVDLRVDFLRPGNGSRFTARGTIMRTGSHLAVVRMDLQNETANGLIASATGTYWIGSEKPLAAAPPS
jgi:uncharacterized protein (TIGR00369 family)